MKRRSAVFLGVLCGVGAVLSDAKAADAWVASPMIRIDGTAKPSEVFCYIKNISESEIWITHNMIYARGGKEAVQGYKTCGPKRGWSLGRRAHCTISTTDTSATYYGCRARVSDPKAVVAAIELRDATPRMRSTAPLTFGPTDADPEKFHTIASAPMFGSPSQTRAICNFTNVGNKPARLANYRLKTSLGVVLPSAVSGCAAGPGGGDEVIIDPGKTCDVSASIEAQHLRCEASVTRAADVRASLLISDRNNVTLSWEALR